MIRFSKLISTGKEYVSCVTCIGRNQYYCSTAQNDNKIQPKTGILMLNMGGPTDLEEVKPFLLNLFSDRDIIEMPFQSILGPLIAARRTPHVQKLYKEIGGKSPITKWTLEQGKLLEKQLDLLSPSTAPHLSYLAFRYAGPRTKDAILQMKKDGIKRVVAFSQFPQWSCATTGSSLNDLKRIINDQALSDYFEWSIIDRFYKHPSFIKALKAKIEDGLKKFPTKEDRDSAVIIFSAHSLPMKAVNRGDAYPQEIGATAHLAMESIDFSHKYYLCYQSQVGRVPWLGPNTDVVLESLGKKGVKNVLIVPIAFTTDHIETLSEIDIDFKETATKAGIENFIRAESFNTDPAFIKALSDVFVDHINSNENFSKQYPLRCPNCTKSYCRPKFNWQHEKPTANIEI